MCSMCHYCGAGLMGSNVDEKKQDDESSLKLNSKVPTKLERENMKLNGTSPFATPHISPTSSLSSDFSVDVNSFDRMSRMGNCKKGWKTIPKKAVMTMRTHPLLKRWNILFLMMKMKTRITGVIQFQG
ncbi:uncharacterized protein LOC107616706 isoform X1 [Arachis ipaensis]|uniref:Uncharacterized protein n=1 Tax=Arachis hypogaea TaxID=3818 RepID=A0A444XRM9_ARAHY|nr:uncharacterized protein LOC107616706 isoform X1 [Arachis ipaensis]XP_016174135.1 uncharacterized protein LOC107616706 isoform X1 [Arachis ipaensis]XP_020966016.1 uncharacterized protein LOC107616706 isoform X1 [Arachis ipaensis]XP_020966017.1 uncharacterized protein LOC107616706 isoform X1 [Arachis ipaensis]XP_020966018.1 uncharacterized protein LOC107616706 isoform X1 [Arachis ipaensis]XP_020966019.1 uncharacterized protein LOC107616706 isoform X1 [Arachis ipaensis]RYQ92407.1 hypothetical